MKNQFKLDTRFADEEDVADIMSLLNSAYVMETDAHQDSQAFRNGSRLTEEEIMGSINAQHSRWLVLEKPRSEGEKVVGCLHFALNPIAAKASITCLAVDQPMQRKGVGSFFLHKAENIIRNLACRHVRMETAKWRNEVLKFLTTNGYKEIGGGLWEANRGGATTSSINKATPYLTFQKDLCSPLLSTSIRRDSHVHTTTDAAASSSSSQAAAAAAGPSTEAEEEDMPVEVLDGDISLMTDLMGALKALDTKLSSSSPPLPSPSLPTAGRSTSAAASTLTNQAKKAVDAVGTAAGEGLNDLSSSAIKEERGCSTTSNKSVSFISEPREVTVPSTGMEKDEAGNGAFAGESTGNTGASEEEEGLKEGEGGEGMVMDGGEGEEGGYEPALEDLVAELFKTLRTDEGRAEFERLVQEQEAGEEEGGGEGGGQVDPAESPTSTADAVATTAADEEAGGKKVEEVEGEERMMMMRGD